MMGHDSYNNWAFSYARVVRDEQFEEDARARWRRTRAKRIAEGKCWQCGDAMAQCECENRDEIYCHTYCSKERREGEDCALNGGCPLRHAR